MFGQDNSTHAGQHEAGQPADKALSRRSFLNMATATAAAAAVATLPALAAQASAQDQLAEDDENDMRPSGLPQGDIAVLKFLATAELVEDDLWQQYCELAVNNPGFHEALDRIDPSLVRYICDDRDDERSHAAFINGFLASIGEEPINLDPFRTLPSVNAPARNSRGG